MCMCTGCVSSCVCAACVVVCGVCVRCKCRAWVQCVAWCGAVVCCVSVMSWCACCVCVGVACWWWSWCVFGVCLVCVCVCCVLRHAEKTWKNPCVGFKNASVPYIKNVPRVCRHQAHMGHVAGTHGNVLNTHRGRFECTHGGGGEGRGRGMGGSSLVLLTKICPRRVIKCFRGSPKETFRSYPSQV